MDEKQQPPQRPNIVMGGSTSPAKMLSSSLPVAVASSGSLPASLPAGFTSFMSPSLLERHRQQLAQRQQQQQELTGVPAPSIPKPTPTLPHPSPPPPPTPTAPTVVPQKSRPPAPQQSSRKRARGGGTRRRPPEAATFWAEQASRAAEEGGEAALDSSLPSAKIKKIMKVDGGIRTTNTEAPKVFAKACELFVMDITIRAWQRAYQDDRVTIKPEDIVSAVKNSTMYDFLYDTLPITSSSNNNPSIGGDDGGDDGGNDVEMDNGGGGDNNDDDEDADGVNQQPPAVTHTVGDLASQIKTEMQQLK